MALYLNTQGRSTLAIGICGRCSRKFPLDELMPDGNSPGLRVCKADRDNYDPYRLPARQPEKITLLHPRPDVSLATDPSGLPTEDDSYFLITEDSEGYLLP